MNISTAMKTVMANTANATVNTMRAAGPIVRVGIKTALTTVVIPTIVEVLLKKALTKLSETTETTTDLDEIKQSNDVGKVYRSASEWMKDHPSETLTDAIYDQIYGGPSGDSVNLDLVYTDYERRYGHAD